MFFQIVTHSICISTKLVRQVYQRATYNALSNPIKQRHNNSQFTVFPLRLCALAFKSLLPFLCASVAKLFFPLLPLRLCGKNLVVLHLPLQFQRQAPLQPLQLHKPTTRQTYESQPRRAVATTVLPRCINVVLAPRSLIPACNFGGKSVICAI